MTSRERVLTALCEVLGRGGGCILGPAHFFQPDVPPENVLAVYSNDRSRE
jgi:hypothetical protein